MKEYCIFKNNDFVDQQDIQNIEYIIKIKDNNIYNVS